MTRPGLGAPPARSLEARTLVVFGLDVLVVANDLADHEAQELLSKIGVEAGGSRKGARGLDTRGIIHTYRRLAYSIDFPRHN